MHEIKISVRNLVEFIMQSGDLFSSAGMRDPDSMQEGNRIHKKLQRQAGAGYRAEVPLSQPCPVSSGGIDFTITVEGRADGIFTDQAGENIDEIKGVYRDVKCIKEPVPVHRAQALCYAYIYALQNKLPSMGLRITYCHIPTEKVQYFMEYLSFGEIETQFQEILQEYAKWAAWRIHWMQTRNASIKKLEFPFPYREGQSTLVKGVYQSILRRKRLYIEAPTGVGKTVSTVFPSVKALGEGLAEKVFYLTAKTITRTVAENTFLLLEQHGARCKYITLTAKEKICILDKPMCDPKFCKRARGHFDRINDAVFDMITGETAITRETVLAYSEKHMVCPFEFSLDISVWCDVIIGDYNYVFDPTAYLKRFFSDGKESDYIFLIDEAHNLVSRAREMYSASVVKEDFLAMKRIVRHKNHKAANAMEACSHSLLEQKRKCDEVRKCTEMEIEPFVLCVMRLCTVLEEYFQINGQEGDKGIVPLLPEEKETLLQFYFELRHFQAIYELTDKHYLIYEDYAETGDFRLHLQCMDPSANLDGYLKKGRCSVFFSATLLPIHYYREQLAGREDDYAIYAPSPFSAKKRLLMVGRGTSTKYTQRSLAMYEKIARYILSFSQGKKGNYLAFFPSYQMLGEIQECLLSFPEVELGPDAGNGRKEEQQYIKHQNRVVLYAQGNSMGEEEREEFLSYFQGSPSVTSIGLCVMGGVFGEGIDLKNNRLIGAVIVGTGLPMVCTENELFREYFDEKKGSGFSYAYQYPGMNKVLQAAGRVIRTTEDIGAILLLDDRFLQRSYQELFPQEWFPYDVVTLRTLPERLSRFWGKWGDKG